MIQRNSYLNILKDFAVMTKEGDWEYIQVAWTAKEESTFLREMRPFEKVETHNYASPQKKRPT